MKKLYTLFAIISVCSLLAQTPQKMSYQSILRNALDGPIVNTMVGMKVSILKGSISGNAVYVETHSATTNINGLISIEIGAGNVVTGTFSAINWGDDSYFIKTETDPLGGNNYTITGTSQLLSVPYALYAENTKSRGKNTVILRGDITDAEAAVLLTKDLGPDTQFINISNTTALTTVNLDTATNLIDFTVENNTALTTLSGNNIEIVYNVFKINKNPQLSSVSFNGLISYEGTEAVTFDGYNNSLTTINLPIFTSGNFSASSPSNISLPNFIKGEVGIGGAVSSFNAPNYTQGSISLAGNTAMVSLNLPNFTIGETTNYYGRYVSIFNNTALTSISLPNLSSLLNITPQENIYIINNNALNTIAIPNIIHASIMIKNNTSLSSVNVHNLSIGSCRITGSPITSLDLSGYTTGYVEIVNSNLQQLNLQSMVSGGLDVHSNSQLSSISFPAFANLSIGSYVRLNNNSLSSTAVNSILNKMLTVTPTSGKPIHLHQQLPAAPPTGQGIIDKATLISTGNTVLTD
jgi:hypothetical protein